MTTRSKKKNGARPSGIRIGDKTHPIGDVKEALLCRKEGGAWGALFASMARSGDSAAEALLDWADGLKPADARPTCDCCKGHDWMADPDKYAREAEAEGCEFVGGPYDRTWDRPAEVRP